MNFIEALEKVLADEKWYVERVKARVQQVRHERRVFATDFEECSYPLADGEHILAHHPDVLRIIEVTDKDVEKQLVTVEGNLTLTTHALLFDTNPMPDDAKWRSRLPWTAVTEILPTTDGYTITARGFTVKARKGSKDVTRTFRFFSLEPEFMALLLLGKHLHKFRVVGKQFV